jgi:VRR-NUC domain
MGPAVTRRRQPEAADQRAVIEHLAWRARPGVFAFHCPNGGWRSRVEGAILKAIGTVAGVPDIICIFEGRCYALELKAERGRLTDVQRITHERLREAGAEVAVAHGVDEALARLEQWRLLRPDVSNQIASAFTELRRLRGKASGAHSPPHPRSNEP